MLHSSLPASVSIVATSERDPERPWVASARPKTPCSGSSGAGCTVATGRAGILGPGGGCAAGAWVSAGIVEGGVLTDSSLRGAGSEGSEGADLQGVTKSSLGTTTSGPGALV